MHRSNGVSPFVIFVLLLAAACADGGGPVTAAGFDMRRMTVAADLPDKPSAGNEGDDYLFEISREVPAYGGHLQTSGA